MHAGAALARARRIGGLSQRELAARAGVPQSTVGRIESGAMDPRTGTLERLLRACGHELEVAVRPGTGVDRTQLRHRLEATPRQRVEHMAGAAGALDRIRRRAR